MTMHRVRSKMDDLEEKQWSGCKGNISQNAILMCYNELSQKTRFQSVPIAALCLYNIQRENLVFKNSLCIIRGRLQCNLNKQEDCSVTLINRKIAGYEWWKMIVPNGVEDDST